MYSGCVKYRVYKKDITHYRIECFNPFTNQWTEVTKDKWPDKLTLFNCKMVVDEPLRVATISGELSGENAPVHAWIECEGYIQKVISLPNILYFNPYRVSNFVNRITNEVVNFCSKVTIDGNTLYYA